MPNPPHPFDVDPDAAHARQARYWIARLAAGNARADELDRLEAWLARDARHARAFARERTLWQDLGAVADLMPTCDTIPPVTSPHAIRRIRAACAAPLALAACLVVMLAGPSLMLDLRADHRTATGEIRAVTLPDGTTALLDSGSAISLDYRDDRRMVHLLAGRAWFDVRHDTRPFMVETLGGITQDIGTGFEVRREADAVETAVSQGMVRVRAASTDTSPAILLHAGERSRYRSGGGVTRLAPRSPDSIAAWRHGELRIESMPVDTALKEIARYRRPALFVLGDFRRVRPISGLFLIDRPDEALTTIAHMRDLQTMMLPGGIMLVRPATGE